MTTPFKKGNTDERLERALEGLGRAQPPPDLSARIIARLPQTAPAPARLPGWLGPCTLLAALLSLAFAFKTALELRSNGVFELISVYSSQPQIVINYPGAAFDVLTSAIPWATVGASVLALGLVSVLVYRVTGGMTLTSRWR